MPYRIIPFREGYKIVNLNNGHYFSKFYMPLELAKAQLAALHIHTMRGGNEKDLYDGGSLSDIYKRIKHVLFNTYSPQIEKYDKLYGDYRVVSAVLRRIPVESAIKKLLNVISLGKFNNYKVYYDDLYHLSVIFTLINKDGNIIGLETQKRPNIEVEKVNTINFNPQTDMKVIPDKKITLHEIFDYAMKVDGKNLYTYDPIKFNCQQYVSTLVHSFGKNLGDEADKFIIQVIKPEFLSGYTKTIANAVTRIGHLFGRLTGKGELNENYYL